MVGLTRWGGMSSLSLLCGLALDEAVDLQHALRFWTERWERPVLSWIEAGPTSKCIYCFVFSRNDATIFLTFTFYHLSQYGFLVKATITKKLDGKYHKSKPYSQEDALQLENFRSRY
jgi:hypothetical protein